MRGEEDLMSYSLTSPSEDPTARVKPSESNRMEVTSGYKDYSIKELVYKTIY